jgi:hypothetical protein
LRVSARGFGFDSGAHSARTTRSCQPCAWVRDPDSAGRCPISGFSSAPTPLPSHAARVATRNDWLSHARSRGGHDFFRHRHLDYTPTRNPRPGGETVAITFHIENAIRGATPGENLTIAQWIGLWAGAQRYRVGERVLLFLNPSSKLGLTSCISGEMGRFTVDPQGRVALSADHLSAFRTDPILGGKSRPRFSDFALAVRRASEEE